MNTRPRIAVFCFLILSLFAGSLVFSGCGPGQFLGPTFTPTPTVTFTPTLTPAPTLTPTATLTPSPTITPTEKPLSIDVIKSAITDDLLGLIVESKDVDPFSATILIGLMFAKKDAYVVDETGAQLDFADARSTDVSGQLFVVFSGASSKHKYQLIQPNGPPIDLVLK